MTTRPGERGFYARIQLEDREPLTSGPFESWQVARTVLRETIAASQAQAELLFPDVRFVFGGH